MEEQIILTCKLGNEVINCYDGTHNKEQLKKWANKKILLCPVCGKPYEYCHGKVKTPYFRHMNKTECINLYSEPETEEHLNGKRNLFEWIKLQSGVTNAVLEGWIPETKQRPDIVFKYYGDKYVIEYQCTPISSEYFERHELYSAAGIVDIWILGWEKYKKSFLERIKYSYTRHKTIEEYSSDYYSPCTNQIIYSDFSNAYNFLKTIEAGVMCKLDSCVLTNIGIIDYKFKDTDFMIATEKRNNRKKNIVSVQEKNKYLKRQRDIDLMNMKNYIYSLSNHMWRVDCVKYSKRIEFSVILCLDRSNTYESCFRNTVTIPYNDNVNYRNTSRIKEFLSPSMQQCIEDAKFGNSKYRLMEVQ